MSAHRLLRIFLLITLGGPCAVAVLMLISKPAGLSYFMFLPLLSVINLHFAPIHAIFGDHFVRIVEFGMSSQGLHGYLAAVVFSAGVSYLAGNLLGLIRGRTKDH